MVDVSKEIHKLEEKAKKRLSIKETHRYVDLIEMTISLDASINNEKDLQRDAKKGKKEQENSDLE